MDSITQAYGESAASIVRWLLPKPWQSFIALFGLATITYGFIIKANLVLFTGSLLFASPFIFRIGLRTYLHFRGRTRGFSDKLSHAVDGPMLHNCVTLTSEDQLAALVITDAGLPAWLTNAPVAGPDWLMNAAAAEPFRAALASRRDAPIVVNVVWVRFALGMFVPHTIDTVESDVWKLVRNPDGDRWARLTGILEDNLFDRWVYVVHPSFGNRGNNRSAYVSVWKVGTWAPKQFSYKSSDSNPAQYRGRFDISVSQELPRHVERRLRSILSEAGFEVTPDDSYTRAARKWYALYHGKDDVIIRPQFFHEPLFENQEPTVVIDFNNYYLGFREDPIVERLPDGRLSILFIPPSWARLSKQGRRLHIDLEFESWIFDPHTRRLTKVAGEAIDRDSRK